MKLTDKVQKIKEWISKEQDGLMDAQGNFEYPEHEGAYHILCNLDTYIDSMQEEPKECMYSKDHYTDEDRKVLCDGCEEECKYAQKEEPVSKDYRERYKRIAQSDEFKRTHDGASIGDVIKVDGEDIGGYDKKAVIDAAMAEVEEKSKAFTDAHKGESADEILAEMRGEEPVSEDFDALDQLLAKYAIDFSYKGKTLKECSGRYKAEIIETVNHLEPVSEDLEKAMQHNAPNNIGIDDLLYWRNGFIAGTKWQKEKEYTCYEEAFEDGAKWKVENLWKPADDDDLPEIDREVIALLDNGKVVFAHRPAEYWDGKNIATGKVTRYHPKTYDKGGWNIPDVKYWLDVELPKEIEL